MTECSVLDNVVTVARKNGKRLPCEQLQVDNAKLWDSYGSLSREHSQVIAELSDAHDQIDQLKAENTKLRERCASLYEFAMSEYPDGTELNFAHELRELGIEVPK